MKKFLKADWKKLSAGCILYILFGVFCALTAEEASVVSATVRLADPETESIQVENRERLARQAAEIEKLRTENIQKETENAQKTAELLKLKSEILRKDGEIKALSEAGKKLENEVKSLSGIKSKLEVNEASLTKDVRERKAEILELNRKLQAKESDIRKLENELTDRKDEMDQQRRTGSKEKSELAAEKALLEEKNQAQRKELLETLERCGKLTDRLKRLEQSAAGVLETLNPVYAGHRETELADALDLVTQCGMKLAGKSTNVCELVLPKIGKLGLNTVEEARLKVAQDSLAEQSRIFARLSVPAVPPEEFQKCRILEVRDDLETVVLNAGYRNGVRVNLTMVVDGVSGCVLKVVAVRPFVSAAVLESGTLQELVPGMEAQLPGKTVQKTK